MANINMKLPDSIEKRLADIVNIKLIDYVEEVIDEAELENIVKEQIKKYSQNIVRQVLDSPDTKSKICQKVYPILDRELGIKLGEKPFSNELNVKYVLEEYIKENPDTKLKSDVESLAWKLFINAK